MEEARTARVSVKTVVSRIRRLEETGVIAGYTATIDMELLGYQYYKVLLNLHRTDKHELSRLAEFIRKHPNIVFRDHRIGGSACEIEALVSGEGELRKLISLLRSEFSGILRSHEVLHYYKQHKLLAMPWAESTVPNT